MTNIRNALMQAAGTAASGDPVYVEDVFSTHLYTGTGSGITINNGIDLSGEGGLVIYRRRDGAENWSYQDTVRGVDSVIYSDSNGAAADPGGYGLASFNSNGFTTELNTSSADYCSWTFRKQEGFFDIVTYTGTGSSKTVSHNLGCVPGMIIVKMTTTAGYKWRVWHKSLGNSKALCLNDTSAESDDGGGGGGWWNNTAPTSSVFSVGTYGQVNNNGDTFVAYLFADGDSSDAQIFGDDGDEAIIKCGSYQSDGNGNEVFVDLGFEPQWVMIKSSTDTQSWIIQDNMRGMAHSTSTNNYLLANSSGAENSEGTAGMVRAESNGMTIGIAGIINLFNSVETYTYVAIRRGPMKEPSAGTDVYNYQTRGGGGSGPPAYIFSHPVDMFFQRELGQSDDWYSGNRLIGLNVLKPDETDALASQTFLGAFDYQNGFGAGSGTASAQIAYAWRRYPKVFDVVFYSPLLSDPVPRNVHNHNLTVKPELIIVKQTTSVYGARNWAVGAPDLLGVTSSDTLGLNLDVAEGGTGTYNLFDSTQPTATQFTVGYNTTGVGVFGESYVAYLFASLDGISKVGTYTGTGSAINVDCGFSGGARWVMVKRTDATADWYIVSSGRGFGKHLKIVSDADESSTAVLDTLSAGFTVRSDAGNDLNASGGTYIYLAFA